MNAKVKISEQLVPFYSSKKLLDAYVIALETTSQVQTLIDRIGKSIVFLKSAHVNELHASAFTELESLLSIARHLSDDFSNSFDIGLEEYKNSVTETECDAGDLLEPYGLAYEVFTWFSTLIYQMKDELKAIKKSSTDLCDAVFASLESLINIADYLSDSHRNTFKIEFEKYEAEWEATKNA
ncbi:hypothetical protein [Acinetobacter sp. YH12098]|uniref:hypothetical protein n=1 Tax=Acinetobacter sp. YH12098 TaxID=2601087 RepID=UPI0015D2B113|nr:hypothetical protein [Acinetobacter sp. YH12098]